MQKFTVKRMSYKDLEFKGVLLAQVDDRHETGRYRSWLELSLYRTQVGRYILGTVLHVFDPPKQPREFYGAVSFQTAWDVYEFLRTEGKQLDELIESLMEQASAEDEAFVQARDHALDFRDMLGSVAWPLRPAAATAA